MLYTLTRPFQVMVYERLSAASRVMLTSSFLDLSTTDILLCSALLVVLTFATATRHHVACQKTHMWRARTLMSSFILLRSCFNRCFLLLVTQPAALATACACVMYTFCCHWSTWSWSFLMQQLGSWSSLFCKGLRCDDWLLFFQQFLKLHWCQLKHAVQSVFC